METAKEKSSILPGASILLPKRIPVRYKELTAEGSTYKMEFYEAPYSNEYALYETKKGECEGLVQVYRFGILVYSWSVANGVPVGDYTVYDNGCASTTVNWSYHLEKDDMRSITYLPKGSVLTVKDRSTLQVVYSGDFQRKGLLRSGYGTVFNRTTGKEEQYGFFVEDKMEHVCMEFHENNTMVEYEDSKENNTAIEDRKPVYIGGYAFDKTTEKYVRHGSGCLLDMFTGMASLKGTWNMGQCENNGMSMVDGKNEEKVTNLPLRVMVEEVANKIVEPERGCDLTRISCATTELNIPAYGCNTSLGTWNVSYFPCLQVLCISSSQFNRTSFVLCGLCRLKEVRVSDSCFREAVCVNPVSNE